MRDFSRVLAKESRAQDTRDAHLAPDASLHWPDLDEQLRGTLRRMATTAEGMVPLPGGCTFTVAVELKEEGEGEEGEGVRAPIGVSFPLFLFVFSFAQGGGGGSCVTVRGIMADDLK
jgi:hypothetical protein